jgi:hypothetical protein
MEYIMYGKLLTHLREQRMKQSSFFNFSKVFKRNVHNQKNETLMSSEHTFSNHELNHRHWWIRGHLLLVVPPLVE